MPYVVLEYCYMNSLSLWHPVFVDIFGQGMVEEMTVYQCFKDPSQFSLSIALSSGRPEFSTFWLDKNVVSSEENQQAIAQACRFGRLDLVETLRARGFPWDNNCHCAAAQYGHIQILQYLHENDCPTNRIALKYAARGGHLDCMKYLRSIKNYWFQSITLEFAVPQHYASLLSTEPNVWIDDWTISPPVGGYLECLRYALENRCPIDKRACDRVGAYGLLDCLQLLHQNNASWDTSTTMAAAGAGHINCLMFLLDKGCPANFLATEKAAANGHLACLQYLHQRVPRMWDCNITSAAASGGHLHCLQFLHEHKYGWNVDATARAAQAGSLECLQFLHVNGCLWNEEATKHAASRGHLLCLIYLHENGCPWNTTAPAAAALNNHLNCLQYLHMHGCPCNEAAATNAAMNGHIDCLRFVAENGCPCCSLDTLQAAAGASSVDCLKYLIEERGAVVPLDGVVFEEALTRTRTMNMRYLIEKGCHGKSFAFL